MSDTNKIKHQSPKENAATNKHEIYKNTLSFFSNLFKTKTPNTREDKGDNKNSNKYNTSKNFREFIKNIYKFVFRENTISFIALIVAGLAALFAYNQTEVAEKSMKISNRPYIIVEGIQAYVMNTWDDQHPHSFEDVRTDVIIKNVGQTPSYKTRFKSAVNIYGNEFPDDPEYDNLIMNIPGIIMAKGTDWKFETKNFREFSAEEIIQVINRNLFIYVYGEITYYDIFDDEHLIKFCFRINKIDINDYGFCEKYNDAN